MDFLPVPVGKANSIIGHIRWKGEPEREEFKWNRFLSLTNLCTTGMYICVAILQILWLKLPIKRKY